MASGMAALLEICRIAEEGIGNAKVVEPEIECHALVGIP
jgi:hypothetical protein